VWKHRKHPAGSPALKVRNKTAQGNALGTDPHIFDPISAQRAAPVRHSLGEGGSPASISANAELETPNSEHLFFVPIMTRAEAPIKKLLGFTLTGSVATQFYLNQPCCPMLPRARALASPTPDGATDVNPPRQPWDWHQILPSPGRATQLFGKRLIYV
jgi:hypothetical protein